tara:strand:- start:912 stop:1130 length:219 start_codon:yes stop_codon:yes gene_type:complete
MYEPTVRPIIGYDYKDCPCCAGAGWYEHGTFDRGAYRNDVELIDPCDYCNGTGAISVPVFAPSPANPNEELS